MHMMPFMKVFAVIPFIPALFVFGMGMVLLHFAKKESSCSLKWGGWVMTIGTTLIMLFLLAMIIKHHCCRHEEGPQGPQGPQCPMMQGMEGSQGPQCPMMQGMHPGPNPAPQQPAPAPHKMMPHHK